MFDWILNAPPHKRMLHIPDVFLIITGKKILKLKIFTIKVRKEKLQKI